MNTKTIASIILGLAILITLSTSVYITNEAQQVIITQFGRPVGEVVTEAGLHVKIPFIQAANYFEKRFLEWDGVANQVPTRDKRFIWVDTYARWRISDPLLFFQRLRDERGAETRISAIIDGETRNSVHATTWWKWCGTATATRRTSFSTPRKRPQSWKRS